MEPDIIKEFLKLPPIITFEGVTFELQIFNNFGEARLCYDIDRVDEKSKHHSNFIENDCWANPFYDGANKGFLFLIEGIETEDDLRWAIKKANSFLKSNRIV